MNKESVARGRGDIRLDIRALAVTFGCLLVPTTYSAEKLSHTYYCPKYEAVLRFVDQRVIRSFGGEFPSGEFTTYTRTGISSSHLVDCSTSEMFCFEERVESEESDPAVFVYAAPKRIKVGDTYQMHGVDFRVDRSPEFEGVSPAVVIFAEGGGQGHRMRYKMRVEQGRGITQLHFERLRSAPPGASSLSREYAGVSCTLVSKLGLLASARLEVPPPEDTID